jgi:uncharacterized protein (TIGR01777 family)
MKIAITGATGLIGRQLIRYAKAGGHDVIRLVRRRSKEPQDRQWNPERGNLDASVLADIDAVIHLAGENIGSGRWTKSKKQRIRDSRVDSTKLLATTMAAMEKPPQALICASAIGFYGERGDEILTEDSPPATGFLPDVCKDRETAADPCRHKVRVVNLRVGIVLSPEGGALAKMLLPFKLGLGGIIGSGDQYWSWVTIHDAAKAFLFAAEQPGVVGVANLVAPNPVTNREFTKALGTVLGRPTIFPVPASLARLALGEMADALILTSSRVIPTRLQQAGFQFGQVDIVPALRSVL